MKYLSLHPLRLPLILLLGMVQAAIADEPALVEIKLGDYRFMPEEIQIVAGQTARLRLVNTDSVVPHNFTLKAADNTALIDVDVVAGETIEVELGPLSTGRYTFYCDKKMLFMKSHRDKGMQGSLNVTAE